MSTRSSGLLRFATTTSTGTYELVRNRRDVARAPADHYTIYLQLSGRTVLRQDDATNAVHGNEILFYDERVPFRATLIDGVRTMAVVPHAMIDRRAPWLRRRPVQTFIASSPYLDLARRHLVLLGAEDATLSENATAVLTENVCNLLALASAQDAALDRLEPDLQIEALPHFAGNICTTQRCHRNLRRATSAFRCGPFIPGSGRLERRLAAGYWRTGSKRAAQRCATTISGH